MIVASTNASLFAYVADGRNGIKVLQLTSPDNPGLYGFSPAPTPELIAWAKTPSPALALSKGLDRDRAVDETGGQMAVFGRVGSRPFTRPEMEKLFLNSKGLVYKVSDTVDQGGRGGRPWPTRTDVSLESLGPARRCPTRGARTGYASHAERRAPRRRRHRCGNRPRGSTAADW